MASQQKFKQIYTPPPCIHFHQKNFHQNIQLDPVTMPKLGKSAADNSSHEPSKSSSMTGTVGGGEGPEEAYYEEHNRFSDCIDHIFR